MKVSDDLFYVSSVLDEQRFTGMDQNPKGIRDLLYSAACKVRELEGELGKATQPHPAVKPITIRGVEYSSHKAAAEALGVDQSTISKAKKEGWIGGVGTKKGENDV